jgi:GTP cyclohydrolase IA
VDHRNAVTSHVRAYQVARSIDSVLKPKGVGVVIKATHHRMSTRDVHKHGADLVTSHMLGCFRESPLMRQELLASTN